MDWLDDNLAEDEEVIFLTRPHFSLFLRSGAAFICTRSLGDRLKGSGSVTLLGFSIPKSYFRGIAAPGNCAMLFKVSCLLNNQSHS